MPSMRASSPTVQDARGAPTLRGLKLGVVLCPSMSASDARGAPTLRGLKHYAPASSVALHADGRPRCPDAEGIETPTTSRHRHVGMPRTPAVPRR